jgi:hypothetical protein
MMRKNRLLLFFPRTGAARNVPASIWRRFQLEGWRKPQAPPEIFEQGDSFAGRVGGGAQ